MIGQALAHYQITDKLGEGGMGVVYRARDTKLGRDVALKVLPEQFARDPQRMGRFEREARVLASLNHPNIAAIHGIEESNGVHALVMELVEGPTLADRIDEGAIPLEEALPLAQQIADALEYAHEKGVVHRDLKPANVKVTEDGAVKVLDFGLAKAMAEESSSDDPAMSPTLTLGATKAGVILGTAAYMAPEQARGKRVDKRADIWAFGVVLYEMVTGKRLFAGEDLTDTLASVVKIDPDIDKAPPQLRRLLRRCFEKDPKKRLRDIGDAWELLEERPLPQVAAPEKTRLGWVTWALLAATAVALLAVCFVHFRESAPELQTFHFTVDPPPGTNFAQPQLGGGYAPSPDGRYLVFSVQDEQEGMPSFWLRPLDSPGARRLEGTEGGNFPTWSPDSRSLAFFQGGQLKRIEIAGGAPITLGEAASGRVSATGDWNSDGVILFGSARGLQRVSASGGGTTMFTEVDAARQETGHGYPQFLPGGDRFLYFVASRDPSVEGVYASSLSDPTQRTLIVRTANKAFYVPPRASYPGYLVWLQDQTLLARPFNPDTLEFEGDPASVAEGISVNSGNPRAAFWVSDAGPLVYFESNSGSERMTWYGNDGQPLGAVGPENAYTGVRLSPDGSRAAVEFAGSEGNIDIRLFDFGRETMTRLTFDPGSDLYPVWSPDGRQIAFRSDRTNVFQIYRKDAAGSGDEERLTEGPNPKYVTDWSPDGKYLLYFEIAPETADDLWALPLKGDRVPVRVRQTSFIERGATFPPDGKWIAYESNDSGRYEVFVEAFPPSGGRWQVSNQGGTRVKWSRDGKELYYVSGNSIMAASIRISGASVENDAPRPVVTTDDPFPQVFSP